MPFQKEEDIVKCELRHKKLQGAATASCRDLIRLMLQKDQTKRISLEEVLRHPWLNEELPPATMSPPASARSSGSGKITSSASLPSDQSSTASSSSNSSTAIHIQEEQVFQPVVVVQYKEEAPAKSYPYLASPMSQNVVHTNECTVHS